MQISKLLYETEFTKIIGNAKVEIESVTTNPKDHGDKRLLILLKESDF